MPPPLKEHGAGNVVGGGLGWWAKLASDAALLASLLRSMPSASSPAIASARLLASVRYCASDCDDTAVLPIATRPRMPRAKIRIATIASMRKKPPWGGATRRSSDARLSPAEPPQPDRKRRSGPRAIP